jgi:hypothetical protein
MQLVALAGDYCENNLSAVTRWARVETQQLVTRAVTRLVLERMSRIVGRGGDVESGVRECGDSQRWDSQ